MRLTQLTTERFGLYRIAEYTSHSFAAPICHTVFTRRLFNAVSPLRPTLSQQRAIDSKRAQPFSTKSIKGTSINLPDQNITMAQKKEKPVFFFDIDNCVSTGMLHDQKTLLT